MENPVARQNVIRKINVLQNALRNVAKSPVAKENVIPRNFAKKMIQSAVKGKNLRINNISKGSDVMMIL